SKSSWFSYHHRSSNAPLFTTKTDDRKEHPLQRGITPFRSTLAACRQSAISKRWILTYVMALATVGIFLDVTVECSTKDEPLVRLILGLCPYSVILNWPFFSPSNSVVALRYCAFNPAFFKRL